MKPQPIAAARMRERPMSKKILRMKKVAERYGVSISTPWRWANEKRFEYLNFPKPVSYGPNTSGIAEDLLDAYDAERVAMRDAVAVA